MTVSPDETTRRQRGITGVESAIILIAFVVVASVFAFTVLSTGVFSAERSKDTIFAGLESARASIEPRGSLIAFRGSNGAGATATVYKVSFIAGASISGQSIDLTPPYTADDSGTDPDIVANAEYRTVISYVDDNQFLPDVPWTVEFVGEEDGDDLLDTGEKAEITVWLLTRDFSVADVDDANAVPGWTPDTNGAHGILATGGTLLTPNDTFSIEIKPNIGSIVTIERDIPVALDPVMDLR